MMEKNVIQSSDREVAIQINELNVIHFYMNLLTKNNT
jgi:hypothetical protein